MYKNLTIISVLGGLAVILGAFGAHTLKAKLSVEAMQSFETAVRYQLFHVLVLLFVNIFTGFTPKERKNLTVLFVVGVLLFSGSIYTIYIVGVPAKYIWFITPLGGLTLVFGWVYMVVRFLKKSYQK